MVIIIAFLPLQKLALIVPSKRTMAPKFKYNLVLPGSVTEDE